MNLDTGVVTKVQSNEPQFSRAVELIKEGKLDEVERMSVKNMVADFTQSASAKSADFVVRLSGGRVMYSWKGQPEKELHNSMTERVIRMAQEGYDVKPLVNFMTNLMNNPSKTSIDELYLFLEATGLPITSDGHFIAYKIVRDDYTSIHDLSFRTTWEQLLKCLAMKLTTIVIVHAAKVCISAAKSILTSTVLVRTTATAWFWLKSIPQMWCRFLPTTTMQKVVLPSI